MSKKQSPPKVETTVLFHALLTQLEADKGVEFWQHCLEKLRPGAQAVILTTPQSYHRTAVSVEDAGFEIRDSIMYLYGDQKYLPIVFARKPFEGTVVDNVLKHGTGAINIDECRVGTDVMGVTNGNGEVTSENVAMAGPNYGRVDVGFKVGRWPTNLIHDGNNKIVEDFPDSDHVRGNIGVSKGGGGMFGHGLCTNDFGSGDLGSAARFYYSAPSIRDLVTYLVKLVTRPGDQILDPIYVGVIRSRVIEANRRYSTLPVMEVSV